MLTTERLLQRASSIITATWSKIVGATLEDNEWIQSTLPMRLTGMGIKDPITILPAARVAASLTYTKRAPTIPLPRKCVKLPEDWDDRILDLQEVLGRTAEPMHSWTVGNLNTSDITEEHMS